MKSIKGKILWVCAPQQDSWENVHAFDKWNKVHKYHFFQLKDITEKL